MGVGIEYFPDDAVSLGIAADPDRTPLISKRIGGVCWIGIEGADGEMLPLKGVRGERAYLPLSLADRLICWHTTADYFEVVRVGAMTYSDLLGAVHYMEYQASASLLGQAVGWLWWRINHPLYGNANDGATVESILDEEGHNALDYRWRTAL